jgi:tetratricopeptide (TPR) repeat protein
MAKLLQGEALDPRSPLALSGFLGSADDDEEGEGSDVEGVEDHQEALEEEKQKEAKFFDTEKERGLEHPDTLAAFFELFDCWIKLYRLNKLTKQLERIVPICRKLGGQLKIKAVQADAFTKWKRSKFKEAVVLFHEMEDLVGKTAALCENIGHTYSSLGDYPKAEKYFSDALTCLQDPEQVLKNGEGNKGGVLLGLGLIKERMGKINEALPVVRQAYDFYKRRAYLPGGQPSLQAKAGMSCAKLHTKLKQYPEAEAMCEEAIQLFEQTCGEDSPLTAGAYHDFANILWEQRKTLPARRTAKRAYEIEIMKDAFDLMSVLQIHNILMDTHLKSSDGKIIRKDFQAYFPIAENTIRRVEKLPQDGNAGVYYKAAGELHMWGASYARSKELLLLASALLSSEVTADCSNLVMECDALAAFCERNLSGEQDSPLEFDLPGAKKEPNDFNPAPRTEETMAEPPKIEEVFDDEPEITDDGVVIEELETPDKDETAAEAAAARWLA